MTGYKEVWMKKFGVFVLLIMIFILEILPYGAILVFAPSPAYTVTETYSYFSLKPYEKLWEEENELKSDEIV